jgi:uncharacterized protein (TIGR02284 family)
MTRRGPSACGASFCAGTDWQFGMAVALPGLDGCSFIQRSIAMTTQPTNYDAGDSGEAVRQLNSLLRGEISAAETYRMAMDKVGSSPSVAPDASLLREMQAEHGKAAQALRHRISALGGQASDSSGAWGAWAQTVQGTMNLFGDTSALKSLKEGEEHGLKDYQEALDDVDTQTAQLIRGELIPAQQRHIDVLTQLITAVGRA